LVRDERRPEDIRKMDGDDSADAARYGLVSGARLAGLGGYVAPGLNPASGGSFVGAQLYPERMREDAAPHLGTAPRFVHGMPLEEQIRRQISATDPTSRAIHSQRLETEAKKFFRPKPLPRRRW
jgi:hypothetical protein